MLQYPLPSDAFLARLEPWQAETFLTHLSSIRAELQPWIPFASRVFDLAAAREQLQRFAATEAADGPRLYGIYRHGDLVGGALYRRFDADQGTCEIGIWLARSEQGCGIGTAACQALIDWAFKERGMTRVEWQCDPDNQASRRTAQRLGMRHEGTLRSEFELNGTRHDTEIWSILRTDPAPKRTHAR